jgi:predicted PurR-regulated permease PerM
MNKTNLIIFIIVILMSIYILIPCFITTSYIITKYPKINNDNKINKINKNDKIEKFNDRMYQSTHTNFPFWNTQIGSTRNMSYDLRGDIPLKWSYTGPWLNSSWFPIHNKPLWLVS